MFWSCLVLFILYSVGQQNFFQIKFTNIPLAEQALLTTKFYLQKMLQVLVLSYTQSAWIHRLSSDIVQLFGCQVWDSKTPFLSWISAANNSALGFQSNTKMRIFYSQGQTHFIKIPLPICYPNTVINRVWLYSRVSCRYTQMFQNTTFKNSSFKRYRYRIADEISTLYQKVLSLFPSDSRRVLQAGSVKIEILLSFNKMF